MEKCFLCPNNCGVVKSEKQGACLTQDKIKIAKYYLHPFEEPIISGTNGSGTIFFCGCSLKCVFCQNYEVSRNTRGKEISVLDLAKIFKELEEKGAHNINLVNPTHYSDKIVEALRLYKPNIPIVYNTHGYEKVEVLEKIDKYIDVYLPDLKYFDQKVSLRYTGKSNYFEYASKAIEFMSKKPLVVENGLIKSGTVVRHLILPLNVNDSIEIIKYLAKFKNNIYISLMSQYTPFGEIERFPELQRKITPREYKRVLDFALSENIENLFVQSSTSSGEEYIPSWDF